MAGVLISMKVSFVFGLGICTLELSSYLFAVTQNHDDHVLFTPGNMNNDSNSGHFWHFVET